MTPVAMETMCDGAKGLSIRHFWPRQKTYDVSTRIYFSLLDSQQVRMLVKNLKVVGPEILSCICFYTSISYFMAIYLSIYIVTRKSLVIPLLKSGCPNMKDKLLQSYHCDKIFI